MTFPDCGYLCPVALCDQTARTPCVLLSHIGTQVIDVRHAPTISKFGNGRNLLTPVRHEVIIREPVVVAAETAGPVSVLGGRHVRIQHPFRPITRLFHHNRM